MFFPSPIHVTAPKETQSTDPHPGLILYFVHLETPVAKGISAITLAFFMYYFLSSLPRVTTENWLVYMCYYGELTGLYVEEFATVINNYGT